ncbi:MAG TPA: dipeptidase [Ktedonobacterales bacterium]|nr:dipeptidase [Ktedonobacterales bacterium]
MAQPSDAALAYADEHRDAFLEDLKALLRIPSISTLPEHAGDVQRAAQFVADQLSAIGLKKVKVIKTAGHPLVYGEWLDAPEKPTVLVYGHYDVQPVDPIDEWKSAPFEPEVRNDNLYARGAVDDKGQMLGLVKALESISRTSDGKFPVNLKVLIEGEEEYGGEAIEAYVRKHPKELACDVALVADTGMPAPGVPSLVYGLRGIVYTEIEAHGAKQDLHSGSYGGVAPNPIHALAIVLADLKGRDGHITIPQLYKKLKPISDEERALWKRSPVDLAAQLKRDMGVKTLPGEQDYEPVERLGFRPTLEVHGIVGGFVGEGAKTVIPATAKAKVSLRLPPELDPQEVLSLLKKRVAELCPPGVKMTVHDVHGGRGVLVPLDSVYIRAAEQALEQEWGRPPVFEREGGSIPVGALFDSELHVPIIFMGTGLPDDNIHAPNEKYHVPNFYHLIRQAIRFLTIIGNDPAVIARPARMNARGSSASNGKKADKAEKAPAGKKATGKSAAKNAGKSGARKA